MHATPLIVAALLGAAVLARRGRLPRPAQLVAGLVFAGLCISGSGLVHLPSLEAMIRDATAALGPYTYALVGILAFLETGAGVGLIAPGELAVILGGVSAGQGEIELAPLIAITWACALAGDITSYMLGRRLGRGYLVAHGPAFGITAGRLERVERYFAAHGGKTILVGRFIGLVRALAPFIAGASRMPPRRFVAHTTVAAGLWALTFCVLGYAFWQSLDQLLAVSQKGSIALGTAVAIGWGVVALARRRRARRRDSVHRQSAPGPAARQAVPHPPPGR